MTEPIEETVGSAVIKINSKEIYRAVKNFCVNELKLDPVVVKQEVRTEAEKLVKSEVMDYLRSSNYDHAALDNRIRSYLQYQLQNELQKMVKDAVKGVVEEMAHKEIEGVIEVLIRDGMEFKIGWNKRPKAKITMVPKEENTSGQP